MKKPYFDMFFIDSVQDAFLNGEELDLTHVE